MLALQRNRVGALREIVERALGGRGPEILAGLQRMQALPGNYLDILERYVGHLLVEGIVQGHEDVQRARQRDQRRLSAVRLDKSRPKERIDGEPVVPADAVDFIRHRRELGRFFEADQVETVRSIIARSLEEGWTVKRTQDELQRQLVGVGRARAHTIARTEATTAFNQGRLAAFRQTDGFVAAVQFLAILDTRTTEMCRARDGLILALDDPALAANTPPLHYSCRSYLSPVSRWELEDKGGQDFLAQERAKLGALPRPLPGFDQPEPPIQPPTPAPRPVPTAPPAPAQARGRKFIEKGIVRGRGRKVKYRREDAERALKSYEAVAKKWLPKLDMTDMDIVVRYVDPRSENGYVVAEINLGTVDGFALLVHECHELKLYFAHEVNPWRADTHSSRYHEFHGLAIIREHSFLLAVARQRGYAVDGIGDLIRTDLNAYAPEGSPEDWLGQVRSNLRDARAHVEIPESTEKGLNEARRFWVDVKAGRLRLEDLDLDALQDPGVL